MMDFLRRLAPARATDAARAVAVLPSQFSSERPLRETISQGGPAQQTGDDEAAFSPDAGLGPASASNLAAQRRPVAGVHAFQAATRPPESGPTHLDSGTAAASTPAQAEAPQSDAARPRDFVAMHGANSERTGPAGPKLRSPVAARAVSQAHESAAAPPTAARVTLPLSPSILAQRALQSRGDNQVVHVTIGRIDVLANTAPAPAVRRNPAPRQATVTLADYLRGSQGGRR